MYGRESEWVSEWVSVSCTHVMTIYECVRGCYLASRLIIKIMVTITHLHLHPHTHRHPPIQPQKYTNMQHYPNISHRSAEPKLKLTQKCFADFNYRPNVTWNILMSQCRPVNLDRTRRPHNMLSTVSAFATIGFFSRISYQPHNHNGECF